MTKQSLIARPPFLIQRAEINRPLGKAGRVSEVLDLDYMGSTEFEWGATAKSLRALQAKVNDICMTVEPSITQDDKNLRVLHTFTADQYAEYLGYLKELRVGKRQTKECTRFEEGYEFTRYSKTDFWWDIENHVMWSFDKIFMNRLGDALVASWAYMDEQKKAST